MSKEYSDECTEEAAAIVEKAVTALAEHFDSVQIFVTRHEGAGDGGTLPITRGRGNWFTRFGQVYEYANYMAEKGRILARKDCE